MVLHSATGVSTEDMSKPRGALSPELERCGAAMLRGRVRSLSFTPQTKGVPEGECTSDAWFRKVGGGILGQRQEARRPHLEAASARQINRR